MNDEEIMLEVEISNVLVGMMNMTELLRGFRKRKTFVLWGKGKPNGSLMFLGVSHFFLKSWMYGLASWPIV